MTYIIEQIDTGPHAGKLELILYVFDESVDVLRMPVVPELYFDNIAEALAALNLCNGGTIDIELVERMQGPMKAAQTRLDDLHAGRTAADAQR